MQSSFMQMCLSTFYSDFDNNYLNNLIIYLKDLFHTM